MIVNFKTRVIKKNVAPVRSGKNIFGRSKVTIKIYREVSFRDWQYVGKVSAMCTISNGDKFVDRLEKYLSKFVKDFNSDVYGNTNEEMILRDGVDDVAD